MWEKNKEGDVLCLECHSNSRQEPAASVVPPHSERPTSTPDRETTSTSSDTPTGFTGRRTRLRTAKGRYGKAPAAEKTASTPSSSTSPAPPQQAGIPSPAPPQPSPPQQQTENSTSSQKKGSINSGRRSLIRETTPMKAPTFDATIITSDTVLHKVYKISTLSVVFTHQQSNFYYYV